MIEVNQISKQVETSEGSLRILDNMQLDSTSYVMRVKEVEAGAGILYPDRLMVMDPQGGPVDLPGEHTTEPTFGLPATWIDHTQREEASFRGLTVVDPATVLTTHITEIIKATTESSNETTDEETSFRPGSPFIDDIKNEGHTKTVAYHNAPIERCTMLIEYGEPVRERLIGAERELRHDNCVALPLEFTLQPWTPVVFGLTVASVNDERCWHRAQNVSLLINITIEISAVRA